MKRNCKQCGKEFEPALKHAQIYCSTFCNHKAQWQKRKQAYVPKSNKPVVYDLVYFDWRDFDNKVII